MVGVLIHVEDGWNYTQSDRDLEIMQMFAHTAKVMGADVLLVVDRTTEGLIYDHGDLDMKMIICKSLQEALDLYPNIKKVFLEQERCIPPGVSKISFDKLKHVEDTVYVFGGDQAGLNINKINFSKEDVVIYMDFTPFALWTITAISLVLYDRKMKGIN